MAPRKKKNWIQGAVKRPGAFTKKATAHGMSVSAYAKKVKKQCKADPTNYNQMWATKKSKGVKEKRTCRQANLALIFEGMAKKRRSRHGHAKRRAT